MEGALVSIIPPEIKLTLKTRIVLFDKLPLSRLGFWGMDKK
jgi:hypothetical protein